MSFTRHAKIGIVGGGPAGAALAIRLARTARDVVLLADGRCRYGVQSFSEWTLATLMELRARRALGVLESPSRRQVQWNGHTTHANQECLVDRREFDRALLEDANESGATIVQARAGRVPAHGEPIAIRCGTETASMTADLWVDASGRTSLERTVATAYGPPTLALQQTLRAPPGAPRSAILSVEDGWFWVGILADGTGVIQQSLALCRRALRGVRGANLIDALAARDPTASRELLGGAKVTSVVCGHPATPRLSARIESPLRAGDALLAADPLSGQGVYEALAGSRHTAAAVNTLLTTPSAGALVTRFLAERTRERFDILTGLAAHAYRQEERWRDRSFWVARHALIPQAARPVVAPRLEHDVPVLDRDHVVPASILVTATHPRGVWRFCDVPVVPFLRELHAYGDCVAAARALGIARELGTRIERWLAQEIPGLDLQL